MNAQSPGREGAKHGDDVSDDVRPGHGDDKVRTSSAGGKSTSESSSSSTTPSRRGAVSASSSEDLFDDEPDKTAAKSAAERRRVPGDLTATSDASRQPVSTSSQRPTSTAQPVTSSARPVTAARVSTFQITPTLRQRAFPRTNPAYIGTYRRDRPPTYRRMEDCTTTYRPTEDCATTYRPTEDCSTTYRHMEDSSTTYRRMDCPPTSHGVASELRPSSSPHSGTRRPSSDGVHRALIQHTGDVVYVSNAASRRGAGHHCTTVVTHQRLHDWTAAGVRPSSDGTGSSALRGGDCRSFVGDSVGEISSVIRRQSEPDYVNVMTRHHHYHHHQQQQQGVSAAGGKYCVDDSEWASHSQLVPSAIYMNQHELTIAGRYTSRSTCNFMDPTANGSTLSAQ